MKGKRKVRSRRAILAAVTVLAAAQATSAYASTGPASESQGGRQEHGFMKVRSGNTMAVMEH